ncbi:MAG: AIR carboxylase family protein, partial [Deltaproteobacteria bacterium]|nr:AIR carboxylase family protein [Deltaproteobacteria bacterium]
MAGPKVQRLIERNSFKRNKICLKALPAYPEKEVYLKTGKKTLKQSGRPPEVGIVMGSDSDLKIMEEAASVLKQFGVSYEMTVASAHRSPKRAIK